MLYSLAPRESKGFGKPESFSKSVFGRRGWIPQVPGLGGSSWLQRWLRITSVFQDLPCFSSLSMGQNDILDLPAVTSVDPAQNSGSVQYPRGGCKAEMWEPISVYSPALNLQHTGIVLSPLPGLCCPSLTVAEPRRTKADRALVTAVTCLLPACSGAINEQLWAIPGASQTFPARLESLGSHRLEPCTQSPEHQAE